MKNSVYYFNDEVFINETVPGQWAHVVAYIGKDRQRVSPSVTAGVQRELEQQGFDIWDGINNGFGVNIGPQGKPYNELVQAVKGIVEKQMGQGK